MGGSESRVLVSPIPETRQVFVSIEAVDQREGYTSYVIILRHRRWTWTVTRRFREVVALDRWLSFTVPDYAQRHARPGKKIFGRLNPKFVQQRRAELEDYLQRLADDEAIFAALEFRQFIDSSAVSFNPKFGGKHKEGYLRKCSGGYRAKFSRRAGDMFNMWRKRWVVFTDAGIVYYRSRKHTQPLGFLQLDTSFTCQVIGHLIRFENATRTLTMRARTSREADEWVEVFHLCYGKAVRREPSPNLSTFPVRSQADVRFYIGGKETMAAMATAMLLAREEIFIAGWWLCPKVYLTRPPDPPLRLDQILRYKAEQGVHVYILLYQEVDFAMANASNQSKGFLKNLHSNIHIVRHPNKFRGGSTALLWSHHDKVVVVDQNVAFVGGVDLAWGRWDDNTHQIEDSAGVMWPGDDYYNPGTNSMKPTRPPQDALARQFSSKRMSTRDPRALLGDGAAVVTVVPIPENGCPEDIPRNEAESMTSVEDLFADNNKTGDNTDNDTVADGDTASEFEPETDEERRLRLDVEAQAMGGQGGQSDRWEISSERPSDASSVASSSSRGRPKRELKSISSIASIGDMFVSAVDSFNRGVDNLLEEMNKPKVTIPTRDLFPRMPWHDVHSCVTGAAARDVAMHFVQRWNHHRLSKSKTSEPILLPVSDNPHFGMCARCKATVHETYEVCAECGYDLGPAAACARPLSVTEHIRDEQLSYIDFTCLFGERLGIRVTGEGPSVVNYVHFSADQYVPGELVSSHGPLADDLLHGTPLIPAVADIVVAVNGLDTSLMGYMDLQKLINRCPAPVAVTLRRYRHDLLQIVKDSEAFFEKVNRSSKAASKSAPVVVVEADEMDEDGLREGTIVVDAVEKTPEAVTPAIPWRVDFAEAFKKFGLRSEDDGLKPVGMFRTNAVESEDVAIRAPEAGETELIYDVRQRLVQQTFESNVRRNIDKLISIPAFSEALPEHHALPGSCTVQVLRSVGTWSIGTQKETSIASTYCAMIMNAKHYIYIENQFFVSASNGNDVKNEVSKWLLERLVTAAQHRQMFRLIIVIPLHPEGDYLNDRAVQVVMHYQYQTICRGAASLIEQFRKRCPWVTNVDDYVSFFSLRTWGVLNEQIVAEQVYIHDKIMIVDDCAMIIGSANINDRSMLGDRDSEIALFVQDNNMVPCKMNGTEWQAGEAIRNIRIALWRKHLGDPNAAVEDPISDETYRILWLGRAELNTHLFEMAVDKAASVYRCRTKNELVAALKAQEWPSASDGETMQIMNQIQGYLVFHPLEFCAKENWALGPTEFFLPSDLFA